MIYRTIVLILLTIFLLFGQTNWTKYPNNPVMIKQNLISEFFAIGQPTVIKDNDTFKMWYCAAGIDHRGRVLYAYSTNGVNWTKYLSGAAVLNIGSTGQWDSKWLDTPEIVRTQTGYYLYYYGDDVDSFPPHNPAIGLATSINGINWTKHLSNPVFTNDDDSTSWEGHWIESPAVLYDNGIYKMWYTGVPYDWRIKIGYATSPDGINWTKYSGNPVLNVGNPGAWDDMWVGVPAVIKRDNRFEMWYSAFCESDLAAGKPDTCRIGYAFSSDGINWTKHPYPVLSTVTPPYNPGVDSNGPWAPDIVFDGTGYRMWYETAAGFCYANAPLAIEETNNSNVISTVKISPNPFSYFLNIEYSGNFSIKIYDVLGKIKRNLSGRNKLIWDGKDNQNQKVQKGIYFLLLESEKTKINQKVIAN